MAERSITFEATLNDETGNLSLCRSTGYKFTALEMIGILESFKLDILKDTYNFVIKPIDHAKKKEPGNI